jgi:guanine deaminase
MTERLILGQVLHLAEDPAVTGHGAIGHDSHGALRLKDGLIAENGSGRCAPGSPSRPARRRFRRAPDPARFHRRPRPLPPDRDHRLMGQAADRLAQHLHLPRGDAFFRSRLRYAAIAERYLDLLLANGTTTVCSYCTIHPQSVDALFTAAAARGMRVLAGKTCMDRDTAPEGLRDTAQSAYDDSKALLSRWHGRGRLSYVITPRFSPTSTEAQLDALGALWAEHPDCLMQTHLSEQTDEIAWVKSLYPQAATTSTPTRRTGFSGPNGLYGHAIHLEPRETRPPGGGRRGPGPLPHLQHLHRLGVFDMGFRARMRVGLATDTGGGSSFSMLRTMAAAYEIAQLKGIALHPAELLWLATGASARALGLETTIGRIAPGFEADLTILDLASTPAIAQAHARAEDIWQALFHTIMMGDDRAIAATYVAGRRIDA